MSNQHCEESVPEPAKLDNLTLARKEGWRALVDAPARSQPELLSRNEIDMLSSDEVDRYNYRRMQWHANFGPIKTPQLEELHEHLWEIVDSNVQDGDKAKGAVAVDAYPGLGKTTAVLALARKYHQREIKIHGAKTDSGHERWPVCRVGLTGNTGMKEFNRAMLEFFAHPGAGRGTAADYARRALDCILSCETKILIIDDLHFLQWRNISGIAVSNHFKYIANEFPITMIYIGVALGARGLFSEGENPSDAVLAQTARRTTTLGMEPFTVEDDTGRRHWHQLLLAIEQRIVLSDKSQGMLAEELDEYLFARSTGHIGSLMTLITRGCHRAVRTGAERLTKELLDHVRNDVASEKARQEIELAIRNGRIRIRRKAG